MKQFENVTVVKKANLYFDGNVTSRTVKFEDGTYKTLGVMMPGEYEFGTDSAEIMEILEGKLDVSLPGSSKWQEINGGDTFEVGANSSFVVRVKSITDYCCSYLT